MNGVKISRDLQAWSDAKPRARTALRIPVYRDPDDDQALALALAA